MDNPANRAAEPPPQKVVVLVRNQRHSPVTFILEPYGREYPMPPGAVFEVRAEGPAEGRMKIDCGSEVITAWAWAGSIAEVYHNGEPLSPGPPHPVPTAMPEGMTVRGFLGMILGDDQGQRPD